MDQLEKLTAKQIAAAAEEQLASLPPDVDTAEKLLTVAYSKDPQDHSIVNLFAQFCFEHGADPETTHNLLNQSINQNQEQNSWRYLYLGQMVEGKDALEIFKAGFSVAERDNDRKQGECCSFLTAIAELFMTDLCDEADAQKNCEEALEKAHTLEPKNFAVLSALSCYNKTIGAMDKGKEFAQGACEVLNSKMEELEKAQEEGQLDERKIEVVAKLEAEVPDAELQIALVRTMVDLSMFEEAENILECLLDNDEEDVQLWYLLGTCAAAKKSLEEAFPAFEKAKTFCEKHNLGDVWEAPLTNLKGRIEKLVREQANGGASSSSSSGANQNEKLNTSDCSTAMTD